jgi:hypothetical protein
MEDWMMHESRYANTLLLAALTLACSGAPEELDVGKNSEALSSADALVLGFERTSDWTPTSGTIRSSSSRTQGYASLGFKPTQYGELRSRAISTLDSATQKLAVDIRLPTQQPNPYWFGQVLMYVDCPQQGIYNQYLDQRPLTGLSVAQFHTLEFPVPAQTAAKLVNCGNLTFKIAVNVPAGDQEYLLDNLRFVGAQQAIAITNVADGETVRQELLIVQGAVSGVDSVSVTDHGGTTRSFAVDGGRFKAIVELLPGVNSLTVAASGFAPRQLDVNYAPEDAGPAVRMVYVLSSDDDGTFQAPPETPNGIDSAERRIRFSGLLMQAVLAELMNEAGHGRKTIRLARNAAREVEVFTHRLALTFAETQEYCDGPRPPCRDVVELWGIIGAELAESLPFGQFKNMAFTGMSRFDPATGQTHAAAALGGGDLAWQGGLVLHAYPENIDELLAVMEDTTPLSPQGMFVEWWKDSYWGTYSVNMGGATHELGHTFGLAHDPVDFTLMGTGLQYFSRVLSTRDGDGAGFAPNQEMWLAELDEIGRDPSEILDDDPWFN